MAGPDGALWCSLWTTGALARVTLEGDTFEHPIGGPGSEPHGLAFASDGSLCVALESGYLARFCPGQA